MGLLSRLRLHVRVGLSLGMAPYRYGNWMFVPIGMDVAARMDGKPGDRSALYTPITTNSRHLVDPSRDGHREDGHVGRNGVGTSSTMCHRVVNAGSAGMGIPRGSFRNLSHLNHQVVKTGSAEVRPAPQFSTTPAGRSSAARRGGPLRGGLAPARSGGSMPLSGSQRSCKSHLGWSSRITRRNTRILKRASRK